MSEMNTALLNFVRQISQEKGLDPLIIKEAIEQAVVSTSKKNLSHFSEAKAQLDLETGELVILARKQVVETVTNWRGEISLKDARKIDSALNVGDEVDAPIPASDFGRVAAQSARQIIMQKLRDAEREKIFEEYGNRVHTVVTGVIQRFERRDAIVNIGDTEGVLPYEEQPAGVRYKFGDRLKCFIQSVEMTTRGPMIRLSRACPDLIVRLFALEVPEIGDGVVTILAIAREAGVRTKIAVTSANPDVDPVGACVGMKGSRVQMIVREFENEKIDIVPHSANPATFIAAALNPAQILRVDLDMDSQSATVIVPKDNLSLAIGKRGQNARLASKLTGWKLDIKSAEEEAERIAAEEARVHYFNDFLDQIELSEEQRQSVVASSYQSVDALAQADVEVLGDLLGGSAEIAEQIVEDARGYIEALRDMQAAEAKGEETVAEGERGEGESASENASPAEPTPAVALDEAGADESEPVADLESAIETDEIKPPPTSTETPDTPSV